MQTKQKNSTSSRRVSLFTRCLALIVGFGGSAMVATLLISVYFTNNLGNYRIEQWLMIVLCLPVLGFGVLVFVTRRFPDQHDSQKRK